MKYRVTALQESMSSLTAILENRESDKVMMNVTINSPIATLLIDAEVADRYIEFTVSTSLEK